MTSPGAPVPRVLIVEDDLDGALSLQALLDDHGFETRCAHDGTDGLAVAAQFDPHFVLLDMDLPLLHGFDVARHLRVNEEGARRFIIATTGMPGGANDCLVCDAHLPKPISPPALLALIEAAWRGQFAGTPQCY